MKENQDLKNYKHVYRDSSKSISELVVLWMLWHFYLVFVSKALTSVLVWARLAWGNSLGIYLPPVWFWGSLIVKMNVECCTWLSVGAATPVLGVGMWVLDLWDWSSIKDQWETESAACVKVTLPWLLLHSMWMGREQKMLCTQVVAGPWVGWRWCTCCTSYFVFFHEAKCLWCLLSLSAKSDC